MRFYLHKVRLNAQGYDASGSYWGIGGILWQYESEDGRTSGHFRSGSLTTRETSKRIVREMYSSRSPTFYR